jgi:hypothetical protein
MAIHNKLKEVVQSNVNNFQQSVESTAKSLGNNLVNSALDSIGPAGGILKAILNGPSSVPALKVETGARVAGANNDWRVRLSLPPDFASQEVLGPLIETSGLVFPYTPTILIQHTANYDAMQPIHSNYPFPAYQNSQIEDLVITGDFFVENAKDAQYWTAMVHYLRSITKMNYGKDKNAGSPPPVVKLNGYGDFVFPNVPVVIRNFTVDLPADVDYIKTQVKDTLGLDGPNTSDPKGFIGWAPVQSQVAVTVTPIYSRAKVSQFSLSSFVKGDYIGSGGDTGGFI